MASSLTASERKQLKKMQKQQKKTATEKKQRQQADDDDDDDNIDDGAGDRPPRFRGKTFYEILDVPASATRIQLKRAYKKQALRYHPDHNRSEHASAEFQMLTLVHQTLGDAARRAHYDKTGRVLTDESEAFEDAYAYYRTQFPKITAQDIEKFRATYVGSADERDDLYAAFRQCKGNMRDVCDSVPFGSADAAQRFVKLVEAALTSALADVPKAYTRAFKASRTGLVKQLRRFEAKEAKEAKAAADELGHDGSMDSLTALIQSRNKDRAAAGGAFGNYLERKYATKKKPKKKGSSSSSTKKRKSAAPPSEEEFQKMQASMLKRAKKKTKKTK
jgi:DnaJ family protein C protein 9